MPPCNRILPSRRGHLLTADAPFIANADTSRAIDAGEAAKLIDALRAKNGVGPDVSAIIMQADGTVVIPEVLRPYMGGKDKLVPKKK